MIDDPSQKNAIAHVRGPCQVIAGPGAGKTHVLVHRIANLTQNAGVLPDKIMVITFTKAAAKEMERRYQETTAPEFFGVAFGTFHSIFFQILRETDHFSYHNILDYKTTKYLLDAAKEDCGIRTDHIPDFDHRILGEFSYIKNSQKPVEEYEPEELTNEEFTRLFERYERKKELLEKLDFDDMLIRTRVLLTNRPEVLEKYRKRYEYYLVDEAQDMNAIQYEVLKMLCEPERNLFLVGDDDQAIYSFRGAKPELFLQFKTDYPDAKMYRLEYNFRCDRQIVQSGLSVIGNNRMRFSKDLKSVSRFDGKIRFLDFYDYADEANGIARCIVLEKQKSPFKTIAVLYRNNRQCRWLVRKLESLGLCSTGKAVQELWYSSTLIQTILLYLSTSLSPRRGSVIKIMNIPQRFLPRIGLDDDVVDFEKWAVMYRDERDVAQRIYAFQKDLHTIHSLPSYGAISYILYKIGLEAYAKEKNQYEPAVLTQLLTYAKKYHKKQELLNVIELLDSERQRGGNKTAGDESNHVAFYSFHGAKGLEFDHVYIMDANEGITPSRHAKKNEEIEEERRMFYVAMTRAKHELSIATIMRQGNEELYPSRFVRELSEDYRSASETILSKASETRAASSSDSMLSNTGEPSSVSK